MAPLVVPTGPFGDMFSTCLISSFCMVALKIPSLLCAITILLDDGFPIIFKQKRMGQDNIHFWIYKFRTMKNKTPDVASHLLKDSANLYTLVGPFLRKFSFRASARKMNLRLKKEIIDVWQGHMAAAAAAAAAPTIVCD